MAEKKDKITIVGLGYVGLPLAIAFAKKYLVTGYDIDEKRIHELQRGNDVTLEVSKSDLEEVLQENYSDLSKNKSGLFLTPDPKVIGRSNIFIITVPTPIDEHKTPSLDPLLSASKLIANNIKKGDVVIYESTVYPGCTEEDCVPILEKYSGLKYNSDFFCGYSPERINPGDKTNTLTKIKKVTSGSNPTISQKVDKLYGSIITAGTHLAPSIKVAEASKAIENAQRDVNISFVNELALIFDRMNLDTSDVLEAASTKWNFLPFKPGLVGGHCIGVDPYYLAYKSESLGYIPEVVLSGRRVNDQMGVFVASKLIKLMTNKNIQIKNSKILILGFTFKENCPDTRNTKVIDIYNELISFNTNVDVYDPWASRSEVKRKYNITLLDNLNITDYDAIIIAVAHDEIIEIDFSEMVSANSVVYDTKSCINRKYVDGRL